jgi:protein-S-isoprenylcysteine O-methyltransferase Ste14
MKDLRNALVKGALGGGCAAAGLMFILFWNMLFSSANAGAMVDGKFRPYQDDPAGYLLAGGGAVLLIVGLGVLFWTWRSLGRPAYGQ